MDIYIYIHRELLPTVDRYCGGAGGCGGESRKWGDGVHYIEDFVHKIATPMNK